MYVWTVVVIYLVTWAGEGEFLELSRARSHLASSFAERIYTGGLLDFAASRGFSWIIWHFGGNSQCSTF